MEFLDIEICDVLEEYTMSGGSGNLEEGDGDKGDFAKHEDFIFDTSEDFDSPYHLFDE